MDTVQKRYAVIVGVQDYGEEFGRLRYTMNDAVRLRSLLCQNGGFDVSSVHLLVDGQAEGEGTTWEAPTKPNILSRLQSVCKAAGPEDLILFYFAGHGGEISETPYLITSDARQNVLDSTALNVDDLNSMLEKANCGCVVRIFDACRSSLTLDRSVAARMTEGFQNALMRNPRGWASLSSCSSGERAYESTDLEQGVFSYYLCEGLEGKATNQQGVVTLERLVEYVTDKVASWCDGRSQPQTPHFKADLSGSLKFGVSVPGPSTESIDPKNPAVELTEGLDLVLSSAPEDSRRLTFISDNEWKDAGTLFSDRFTAKFEHFYIWQMKSTLVKPELRPAQAGSTPVNEFIGYMGTRSVGSEFLRKPILIGRVDFEGEEIIVPTTTLYVVLARFRWYLWLWHHHVLHTRQFSEGFKPKPPHTQNHFTFKASGVRDPAKIDEVLDEILAETKNDILLWAGQLREYVEKRMEPLRKEGRIVE